MIITKKKLDKKPLKFFLNDPCLRVFQGKGEAEKCKELRKKIHERRKGYLYSRILYKINNIHTLKIVFETSLLLILMAIFGFSIPQSKIVPFFFLSR